MHFTTLNYKIKHAKNLKTLIALVRKIKSDNLHQALKEHSGIKPGVMKKIIFKDKVCHLIEKALKSKDLAQLEILAELTHFISSKNALSKNERRAIDEKRAVLEDEVVTAALPLFKNEDEMIEFAIKQFSFSPGCFALFAGFAILLKNIITIPLADKLIRAIPRDNGPNFQSTR